MSRRGEVDVSVGDSRGDADQVSDLPIFHNSLDWNDLFAKYPVPDVFERTVYKWSPERIRKMQSERFLELVAIGWANPFYSRRWSDAGIGPGDIRSLDDIVHLPIFTSEDIKNDQLENPPFGLIHSGAMALRGKVPLKVHTSGGTTGKPRPTLYLHPGRPTGRHPSDTLDQLAREFRLVRLQGQPRLPRHHSAYHRQWRRHPVASSARDRLRLGHQFLDQLSGILDAACQGGAG